MKTRDDRKYYDLTLGQKLLIYSQTFTIHKQINNIFMLMLLEKKLDFQILKSAVQKSYQEIDAFRLRMKRKGVQIKQYFVEADNPEIGLLDFSGKTKEEMDKHLSKLAHKPIGVINRPLSKVFLVKAWDGTEGIYFGVSHMILDAWGIYLFLQNVIEAYEAMKSGTAMPKPLSPLEPLLQKELAYKDSPQYQKDIQFWQDDFNSRGEPLLAHINGPSVLEKYRKKKKDPNLSYAKTIGLRTAARHEVYYIPMRLVNKVKEYCEEKKISEQSIYMFGVRTALSKLNNRQKDIGFSAAYARRGTLQEKRSGGSRAQASTFRTIIKEETTFDKACCEIYNYQMQIYRHAEADTLKIINMEAKTYGRKGYTTGWNTILFSFQPIKLVLADGTPMHSNWYCNGAFSTINYIMITDADGTGALRCYHEYLYKIVKAERIKEFQSLFIQAVSAGINDPSMTVGDILDAIDVSPEKVAETVFDELSDSVLAEKQEKQEEQIAG